MPRKRKESVYEKQAAGLESEYVARKAKEQGLV